jgi:hypothetical protein
LATAFAAGCQLIENPFVDPMAGAAEVATASVEGVFAVEVAREQRERPFMRMELYVADGGVTHGPLYFEDLPDTADAFAEPFVWSGADYWVSFISGPRRFLANMLFFPVSAVDTPPWMVMVSDGRPSRTVLWAAYDAAPPTDGGHSPDGADAAYDPVD